MHQQVARAGRSEPERQQGPQPHDFPWNGTNLLAPFFRLHFRPSELLVFRTNSYQQLHREKPRSVDTIGNRKTVVDTVFPFDEKPRGSPSVEGSTGVSAIDSVSSGTKGSCQNPSLGLKPVTSAQCTPVAHTPVSTPRAKLTNRTTSQRTCATPVSAADRKALRPLFPLQRPRGRRDAWTLHVADLDNHLHRPTYAAQPAYSVGHEKER